MSYSSPRILTCPTPECKTKTCNSCKAHVDPSPDTSHVCQKDADDQDVLALAKQVEWARCPGCEALVELNLGCFHMTCRCKTEFCYRCQEKWKSCRCPQWEEQHLIAAAEARVDAQLHNPDPPLRRTRRVHPHGRAVPLRAVSNSVDVTTNNLPPGFLRPGLPLNQVIPIPGRPGAYITFVGDDRDEVAIHDRLFDRLGE